MLEGLGQLFVELVLLGTGHAVLWALTLCRWRGFWSRGRAASFWDNFLATLMGFLVWVCIAVVVVVIIILANQSAVPQ